MVPIVVDDDAVADVFAAVVAFVVGDDDPKIGTEWLLFISPTFDWMRWDGIVT